MTPLFWLEICILFFSGKFGNRTTIIHNNIFYYFSVKRQKEIHCCTHTQNLNNSMRLVKSPKVKSAEELDKIMRLFHAAVNAPDVVCCVCDQFLPISKSKLVSPASLPPGFFEKLKKPTGQNGEAELLHPILSKQHNVSDSFPDDRPRFDKLLFFPRGIEKHRLDCRADFATGCDCKPKLRICVKKRFKCLKQGRLPKFSIANGLWFGQLPEHLREVTLGTRSLIRPVHSSGHLVAFSPKNYIGGTTINGHIYSNRIFSSNAKIYSQKFTL